MRYLIIGLLLFGFGTIKAMAQDTLRGLVLNQLGEPLPFASIIWKGSNLGVQSNEQGLFAIAKAEDYDSLSVSYVGHGSVVLAAWPASSTQIIKLQANAELSEVKIEDTQKSTTISSITNMKTEFLSQKEFKKAACCTISESFETNATVEVSFPDALTGMRQIQLLGLSGIYAQTLTEGVANTRGLMSATGLGFIPGPFAEGVHLSKGTGSVVYGYESMSGQINIELMKPEKGPFLFVNGYANIFGRTEMNVATNHPIGKRWHTGILLNGNLTRNSMDPNKDGFYNMPSGEGFNLINRWKYQGEKWEGMVMLNILDDKRTGGQVGYKRELKAGLFGIELDNRQYNVWTKWGLMPNKPDDWSIGFIGNYRYHDNHFKAGNRLYKGAHHQSDARVILNKELKGETGRFTAGASFISDVFDEHFTEDSMHLRFSRIELVPGVFGEYSYMPSDKFSAVFGLRGDYHQQFGFFATPRMHIRFAPNSRYVYRIGAGRGQRVANIFAENNAIFASSRRLMLPVVANNYAYGLNPEVSWNLGGNFTYNFSIGKRRSGQFTADYYFVHFVNQAVIDVDGSAREIRVYNLNGKSFSQTFQAQLTLEPFKRMEIRLAYRYLDVQTTYDGVGTLQKVLQSPHRGFFNIGYETKSKWSFDGTLQLNGRKRLPLLADNPASMRFGAWSPAYTILNLQVGKVIGKWEFYLGGENLLNVMQRDLILDSGNPFGDRFDASMVWGPTMGSMAYIGFRYTLEEKPTKKPGDNGK